MKTRCLGLIAAIVFQFLLQSCAKSPEGAGEVEFQITDSPSDDPAIAGVYVTISELKVDGNNLPGIERQTINLKELVDGKTRVLGKAHLGARAFDNVVIVLDVEHDAEGNSPGCYVLTTGNEKIKLSTNNTISIPVQKVWNVSNETTTKLVLDFDIRKSIQQKDAGFAYSFIDENRMAEALRLVDRDNSGMIAGTYADPRINNDKIIVYVYAPGTFNYETETSPQGLESLRFRNAISSAEVKVGPIARIYTLAFLEEGKYDLRFASYTINPATGHLTYKELLDAQTSVSSTVSTFVKVEKGAVAQPATTILHNWFNTSLLGQRN